MGLIDPEKTGDGKIAINNSKLVENKNSDVHPSNRLQNSDAHDEF